jgi:hypothetical protein
VKTAAASSSHNNTSTPTSPSTPPPISSSVTSDDKKDAANKIKLIHQAMEILIIKQEIALLQEKVKCKNLAIVDEYEKKFSSLKLDKLGLQLSILQTQQQLQSNHASNDRYIREEAEFNIVKNMRDKVLTKRAYIDLRKKTRSFEDMLEEQQQQQQQPTRSPKRKRK